MTPEYTKLADGSTQCTVYFETHPIRVSEEGGDLKFCLADVCAACGSASPQKALDQIRIEFNSGEQFTAQFYGSKGVREATVITEPQLYFLMMRGRSETAKRFRQWVYNDLIPTLRRTGHYQVRLEEVAPAALPSPESKDASLPAVPTCDQDGNYPVSYLQMIYELSDHYGMSQQGRDLLAWCIDRAKAQGYAIAKHQGGSTQVNWGLSEEQVKQRIEAATLCLRVDLAKSHEACDKLEAQLKSKAEELSRSGSKNKEAQADTQELRTKLELALGLINGLLENPESKALPQLAAPLIKLLAPVTSRDRS